MTRPNLSALVLDGQTVKLRLQAERSDGRGLVHVDWLRFTLNLRDAPFDLDLLFPPRTADYSTWWDFNQERVSRQIAAIELQENFSAAGQALTVAREVAEILGEGYAVAPEILRGHDFYASRWPITLNDAEVGWVGFGASSASPRQQKQSKTIHVNLYGAACTFAKSNWRHVLADKLDEWQANITRCDLALDFFDGYVGGLDSIVSDYKAGAFDFNGQRPKPNQVGDWINNQARSFYIGSREAGKQTNIYEKGDQLFGVEACSPWLRWELRYGNKLRELSTEMLRDPDAFFAGASDAHRRALETLAGQAVQPEAVSTRKKLAAATVEAEVFRNVTWLERVAAPSLAAAWQYLGDDGILALVSHRALPRRLQRFADQVPAAFRAVGEKFFSHGACPSPVMA